MKIKISNTYIFASHIESVEYIGSGDNCSVSVVTASGQRISQVVGTEEEAKAEAMKIANMVSEDKPPKYGLPLAT